MQPQTPLTPPESPRVDCLGIVSATARELSVVVYKRMSNSAAKTKSLPRIDFDAPARVSGMHERRARLPKRAYLLPRLLSRDEATLVRRLVASDRTARFARDPDTVDRLPTFECAVFDGGQPVATAVCRVLEPVVTTRLLPYLRKRFDCPTLELSQALIRRYLPTERREHPAHFDAHAPRAGRGSRDYSPSILGNSLRARRASCGSYMWNSEYAN